MEQKEQTRSMKTHIILCDLSFWNGDTPLSLWGFNRSRGWYLKWRETVYSVR